MPLVRIDLIEGRRDEEVRAIGDAIHRAIVECLDVPERDRFQVVTEHRPGRLVYDRHYLEGDRTAGIVVVQVFFSEGRSVDQKRAFYSRAAALLESSAGVRPQDAMISLVENTRADWSFGNGIAQYVAWPRERWK